LNLSSIIYRKLEAFIRKFYYNQLIRGGILFIGFGLLYFLFTLFIEYFLWLKPMGRSFLFWTFVVVELFLLIRFIFFPVFQLLKLKKGIDYREASLIIGNHFPNVNDKLTNFLQLLEDPNSSELLVASIEQKANSLQPIPFGNAVDFSKNSKYLPLAIIPILFFMFFYLSGNSSFISQSLDRVVHFNLAFSPPAPFEFVVLNTKLQTKQNEDFILRIKSVGKIVPEKAMILIDNQSYFMETTKPGEFQFKIAKPSVNIKFHLEANTFSSMEYELKVTAVPTIANFEMILNYPAYLNRKQEIIKGTGNAIIPEGTQVHWSIKTQATESVNWIGFYFKALFQKNNDNFVLSKTIFETTEYEIHTSNSSIKDYEKLAYELSIIKDQFPTIVINTAPDSLKVPKKDKIYLLGQISDDYGLTKLNVVYYPKNSQKSIKRAIIEVKKDVFDQFVFSFPSNLTVDKGLTYEYYFEVFDNDALHNFKSTKSSVFSSTILTDVEKDEMSLKEQKENINSLEKSLRNQDKQFLELDKLQQTGKEKTNLESKDQQKVNDFIERQKHQDEMMKQFSKNMEENLDKFKSDNKDEFKEELQKRLENADKDLDKNKKLLEELKELNNKIKEEDLLEKLDKFKQNSKNQTKNLEQLVELTKKYYVEKKAEQLTDQLDQLSVKQEQLSSQEQENTAPKQEEINKSFEKIQEDLNKLDNENKELKDPIDIPKDAQKEQSIEDDLKKATDDLSKNKKDAAKPKQKSASKKMKELAQKMKESMESGEKEQMEEDIKTLRQILDNLLAFSFSQEDLMSDFKTLKNGSPSFNKKLKLQQDLKQQFKHVDDSLFAMSLRNPKIAEDITKEIGNVHYNIDKSLESFVEAQLPKGLSHQQYSISSSNKLADFLSDLLNNMQMSMSGKGSGKPKPGKGQGMQLPDIIKKQDQIGQQLKDGIKKGDKPGTKEKGDSGMPKNASGGKGEEGENGENDANAILQIYKDQQSIRNALEFELKKQGLSGNGQNVLDQMKQIEKQLLDKGFNNQLLQKVLNIKYELLKLQDATLQQGEDKKRQSESNIKTYKNQAAPLPLQLQDYINSIEILNRQSLPLRSNFNQKVKEYFKNND